MTALMTAKPRLRRELDGAFVPALAPVIPLRPVTEVGMMLGPAVEEFTATRSGGTRRKYAGTLARMVAEFGPAMPLDQLDRRQIEGWLVATWPDGKFAPDTFNTALATVKSAVRYWRDEQEWLPEDFGLRVRTRKVTFDRTKVMTQAAVRDLLGRPGVPLPDRALWSLLYWSACRASEGLSLRWENVNLGLREAPVVRKGGDTDFILWFAGTAVLLDQLRGGRTAGPVFGMSYRSAARHFKNAMPGRETLHWLRHSRCSHLGDAGLSAHAVQAVAGHSSIRTSERYVHLSKEALRRLLEAGGTQL